ncbi:hypothetical protein, partial [Pseudodesulfovibrio pelocollis]|uniref:hypothetical protein n=1 Tax=Pseudodesulfovibrio pelocollis TaxID=3051432 RepID=UPI00255ACC73
MGKDQGVELLQQILDEARALRSEAQTIRLFLEAQEERRIREEIELREGMKPLWPMASLQAAQNRFCAAREDHAP